MENKDITTIIIEMKNDFKELAIPTKLPHEIEEKMNITQESEEQFKDLKKLKLKELRAYQDLIYGDCLREDRTLQDVIEAISIMKAAFNITTTRRGLVSASKVDEAIIKYPII